MRALITGAAGFIGSHLAQRLRNLGHTVTGIDNFSDYYPKVFKQKNALQLQEQGVSIKNIDLREFNFNETGYDYIFHLAAQPGNSPSITFEDYKSNNITATQNLLDYAVHNPPKLFVNISTSSVYGVNASLDETAVPEPVSFYGVTKLAAEQLAMTYSRQHLLPVCSLRLYSVYGPGERPDKLYTKLIKAGLEDSAFPLFHGSEDHHRSYSYVEDIVDGIISVIGKEDVVDGEIINLGSDAEHTTKEGIEVIESLLGKKIKMQLLPPRPGDQQFTKAIIGKAQKLLAFSPKTSLYKGLSDQVTWFKEMYRPMQLVKR